MNKSHSTGGQVTSYNNPKLIFDADTKIGTETNWTSKLIELDYFSDDKDEKPEMINVIFSCNNSYWDSENMSTGQDLYIDEVKLIYYSRLADQTIGDVEIVNDVYEYTTDMPLYELSAELAEKLDLYGQGKSATIGQPILNTENKTITITVKGIDADEDGETEHTYTIRKAVRCSQLESLTINGVALDLESKEYPGFLRYVPDELTEENTEFTLKEENPAAKISITKDVENNTFTITVDGGGEDEDGETKHTYIFTCLPYIGLTGITFTGVGESLKEGETLTIAKENVIFDPEDASEKDVTLSAEAENGCATITENEEDGSLTITGVKNGTVTVTATSGDKTATAKINIVELTRPTAIKIADTTIKEVYADYPESIEVKYSFDIEEFEVKPTVTISSSNTEVATVNDENKLEINGVGTAEITVAATFKQAGSEELITLSDAFTLTVKAVPVYPEKPTVNAERNILFIGEDNEPLKINVEIPNKDEVNVAYKIKYECKDGIVNVDKDGNVTLPEEPQSGEALVDVIVVYTDRDNKEQTLKTDGVKIRVVRPITELTWPVEAVAMEQGQSPKFIVSINPEDADNQDITYTITPAEGLTYNEEDGTISATADGSYTITASVDNYGRDAITAELPVEVKSYTRPTAIKLDGNATYLYEGTPLKLAYTFEPKEANVETKVTWSCPEGFAISEEGILSIEDATQIPADGKVSVKATAKFTNLDGTEGAVEATHDLVVRRAITAIKWSTDDEQIRLHMGDEMELAALPSPADLTDENVSYEVEDEEVATLADGKLTAIAPGTTTIIATANNYSDDEASKYEKVTSKAITVTVSEVPVYPSTFIPADTIYSMFIGEKSEPVKLGYTIEPSIEGKEVNVETTVTYSTESQSISVDKDGNVTLTAEAQSEHEPTEVIGTLTWTDEEGESHELKGKWNIRIIRPITMLEWNDADGHSAQNRSMEQSQTPTFTVKVYPEDADEQKIKYTITPEEGLTRDEDGTLHATQLGTYIITASVDNYKDLDSKRKVIEDKITITVNENHTPIVSPEAAEVEMPSVIYLGETEDIDLTINYISEEEDKPVHADTHEYWNSDCALISFDEENGKMIIDSKGSLPESGTAKVHLLVNWVDEAKVKRELKYEWTIALRRPVTAIQWLDSEGNEITAVSINDNETAAVSAVALPADNNDPSLTVSVDGDAIEYEDGVIKAVKPGEAKLIAKVTNFSDEDPERQPIEVELPVTVVELARPTAITIDEAIPAVAYIGVTEPFAIGYTFIPAELDVEPVVTWSSSDPEVAAVNDDGLVEIKAPGTAKLTVTATFKKADGTDGEVSATHELTVYQPVTAIEWQSGEETVETLSLVKGDKADLRAIALPSTAIDKKLTYEVEGDAVAYDEATGELTAVATGSATITAVAVNYPEAGIAPVSSTITVNVAVGKIYPDSIKLLSELPAAIYAGETEPFDLKVDYLPAEDETEAVNVKPTEKWSSSHPDIAIDDEGHVTVAKELATAADQVTFGLTSTYTGADGEPAELTQEWTVVLRQPVTSIEWRDAEGQVLPDTIYLDDNAKPMLLSYVALPATHNDGPIHLYSTDGKSVSYIEGVLSPVEPGTTELLTSADNFKDVDADRTDVIGKKLTVVVKKLVRPAYIELPYNPEMLYLGESEPFMMNYAIIPDTEEAELDVEPHKIEWTSSMPELLTVDEEGNVELAPEAVLPESGEAEVTITLTSTHKDARLEDVVLSQAHKLIVRQGVTAIEWVDERGAEIKSLRMDEGDEKTLGAIILTPGVIDADIEVESDNEAVAIFDNGKVKALSAGTATLTAYAVHHPEAPSSRSAEEPVRKVVGTLTVIVDELTGIEEISADATAEYYNLKGIRVAKDRLVPGIYIERRGNQARKIRIK